MVPGYRGYGSPVKQLRAEERRWGRERRREMDDEYMEAVERHRSRHPAVQAMDEMVTADEVVDDPAEWRPDENDYAHPVHGGVDTRPGYAHGGRGRNAWERVEDVSTIQPPIPTSLDPTAPMEQVARFAGYGPDPRSGRGHDAMEGVAAMTLGWVDANRELEVRSWTPGGPLEVAPSESIYRDDHMAGTHDMRLGPVESGAAAGWTDELEVHDWEPEYSGDLEPDDWCS